MGKESKLIQSDSFASSCLSSDLNYSLTTCCNTFLSKPCGKSRLLRRLSVSKSLDVVFDLLSSSSDLLEGIDKLGTTGLLCSRGSGAMTFGITHGELVSAPKEGCGSGDVSRSTMLYCRILLLHWEGL